MVFPCLVIYGINAWDSIMYIGFSAYHGYGFVGKYENDEGFGYIYVSLFSGMELKIEKDMWPM